MLYQVVCRLRQQYLSTMRGLHDPCCIVYVQANIALADQGRLTCMKTHTHSHYDTFGPGMSNKGTLGSHCCQDSLSGPNKNDEETIPLRIDLVTVMLAKSRAQQIAVLAQHASILLAQLLEQVRRPLDVSKEQCDGSCRQLRHAKPSYTSYGVSPYLSSCAHIKHDDKTSVIHPNHYISLLR